MMPEQARAFVVVHAVLAVLATIAALAASATVFWRRAWFTRTALLALLLSFAAFVSGMRLDAPYRSYARQRLFVVSPTLGWLFERKMHASFIALALAVIAVAAASAASRLGPEAAVDARRASSLAAVVAAVLALFATLASFAVAPHVIFR